MGVAVVVVAGPLIAPVQPLAPRYMNSSSSSSAPCPCSCSSPSSRDNSRVGSSGSLVLCFLQRRNRSSLSSSRRISRGFRTWRVSREGVSSSSSWVLRSASSKQEVPREFRPWRLQRDGPDFRSWELEQECAWDSRSIDSEQDSPSRGESWVSVDVPDKDPREIWSSSSRQDARGRLRDGRFQQHEASSSRCLESEQRATGNFRTSDLEWRAPRVRSSSIFGHQEETRVPNSKRIQQSASSSSSTVSQYATTRNRFRAPWEQGADTVQRIDREFNDPRSHITDEEEKDEDVETATQSQGELDDGSPRFQQSHFVMDQIAERLRYVQNTNPVLKTRIKERKFQQMKKSSSQFSSHPESSSLSTSRETSVPAPGWGQMHHNHSVLKPTTTEDTHIKFPWERGADQWNSREEFTEKKVRVKPPTMAELTIPEDELKRLWALGLVVRRRLKIGRLGVTPGIVDAIHEGWRTEEIVKVKCDGPPALNMKKTHEDLESRTGGLVIWRSGGAAVVYRGKNYVPPSVHHAEEKAEEERKRLMSLDLGEEDSDDMVTTVKIIADDISGGEETLIGDQEKEVTEVEVVDDILEGLGPRYSDWAGGNPVPIDGDLLLGSDTVFKKPYRLLPYGMKPGLSPVEITELRHLVRHLPPHFVLGRNKDLRGVAAALVKLWEKIEVAKVSVKRGVLNTNNERIAMELKRLAGGTLLYRDKHCFVLYRGKDFLPPAVQAALEERDAIARSWQEDEERVRMGGHSYSMPIIDTPTENSKAGTLVETLEAQAKWTQWKSKEEMWEVRRAAHKAARIGATQKIESKVELTFQKIRRAEKEIAKLDQKLAPPPLDREQITAEEKNMFVKLGRRMHAFLLMGRRGVFCGIVQNMHLHWKYRELVKIIVKEDMEEAVRIAKMLESESGGLLVDVITVSKGQAIIMYRGKNYDRPSEIKPRHLLTKREALKLSLELQRKKSLEGHVAMLQREIEKLKAGLEKMEEKAEHAKNRRRVEAGQLKDLSTMGTATESSKLGTPESHEEDDADDADDDSEFLDKEMVVIPEPFYRLDPLTRKERNILKKQAATFKRAAHFNVGARNVDEGLAKSIRLFFQNHAIVKLGVKGRGKGTSVADIVQQLEDATGGILVSSTSSKLIFYRGWLEGEERPDLVTKKNDVQTSEVGNASVIEDRALDLKESDSYGSGDEGDEGDEGDDWGLSEDESDNEEIDSEEFGQSTNAQIVSELDADVDDDRELASVDFKQDFSDETENKLGENCIYEAMDQLVANDAQGSSSEEVSEVDIGQGEGDLLCAELQLMENIEGDKDLLGSRFKREEICSERKLV